MGIIRSGNHDALVVRRRIARRFMAYEAIVLLLNDLTIKMDIIKDGILMTPKPNREATAAPFVPTDRSIVVQPGHGPPGLTGHTLGCESRG
jgi:hypothetical protein